MVRRWLVAFIFTQLVEIPIYGRMLNVSVAKAAGASAITHPIVWLVFLHWGKSAGFSFEARAVAAELFAWLVEALYFWWLVRPRPTAPRALLVSLLANGVSLGLGLLANHWFGWP